MHPELAQLGLAGLVISVLAGVVVYQQRRIDSLYKDKEALYKEKEALQEKRYIDLMEIKDKYDQAMSGFSQTVTALYNKLNAGKGE